MFEAERQAMVEGQLVARGIRDPRVLAAMARVPRHAFVPAGSEAHAYEDRPLGIGHGQTISQPYMVARMTELCAPRPIDRVLEIGAGSGYQTAVLSWLCREVWAVEIVPALASLSAARLRVHGGGAAVEVGCFDGSGGWPEHAPYDAVLVAAGAPAVPPLLLASLADGGRLVIPVGNRWEQRLVLVRRTGDRYDSEESTPCRFVDLVGRYGWDGPGAAQA